MTRFEVDKEETKQTKIMCYQREKKIDTQTKTKDKNI